MQKKVCDHAGSSYFILFFSQLKTEQLAREDEVK